VSGWLAVAVWSRQSSERQQPLCCLHSVIAYSCTPTQPLTHPQGYAALGFTANAGSMYPSDSVIGWVAPDGSAKVTSYHLTSYDVTPGDAVTGWAGNMGVVKTGGKTVVCFSRAMDAAAAKAVPKLNAAGGWVACVGGGWAGGGCVCGLNSSSALSSLHLGKAT